MRQTNAKVEGSYFLDNSLEQSVLSLRTVPSRHFNYISYPLTIPSYEPESLSHQAIGCLGAIRGPRNDVDGVQKSKLC